MTRMTSRLFLRWVAAHHKDAVLVIVFGDPYWRRMRVRYFGMVRDHTLLYTPHDSLIFSPYLNYNSANVAAILLRAVQAIGRNEKSFLPITDLEIKESLLMMPGVEEMSLPAAQLSFELLGAITTSGEIFTPRTLMHEFRHFKKVSTL